MIVVTVGHCSCDPGSEEALSRAFTSKEQDVTGVDILEKLFLADAVESPK